MKNLILIIFLTTVGMSVQATTKQAPEVIQEIDKKVEDSCKNEKESSECRTELRKCVIKESEDYPFDALEALERCAEVQP